MKETFKLMTEDGGWYDGLCVFGGFLTMMVGILLMIAVFG